MPTDEFSDAIYERLTAREPDQGELGGEAAEAEARNGLIHMASLSLTKIADGLIDPKLVLSWMLNGLGAPGWIIGALVPIREAGALLPQLFLAPRVRAMRHRKWAWVFGSAGQGGAALAIAAAAVLLAGVGAGLAFAVALGALALARAGASVSYKDILGKTVGKSRRGAVTGLAGSVSAAVVLAFALSLIGGVWRDPGVLAFVVALAGCLWLTAALMFSRIREMPSDAEPAATLDNPLKVLAEAPDLRLFVLTRGCLVATALSPPFLVVLLGSRAEELGLQSLGAMVLASSGAALLSSYVWGRLADRSSRRVLMLAGIGGAAAMLLAVAAAAFAPGWVGVLIPVCLFGLMIAHHGVRQGRSTYLVDLAPEDQRSTYAAVANTVIGLLLLAAGAVGGGLSFWGAEVTLIGFALLALAGAALAARMKEVEHQG